MDKNKTKFAQKITKAIPAAMPNKNKLNDIN
jgi:hypothetical protein